MRLGVERLELRENPSGGSFWDDTYVGAFLSGGAQGAVNLVNGVQDAVVGVANLPAVIYNNTAGNLGGGTISYIDSPDWSRDLIYVGEPTHGLSKFLGGNGAIIFFTAGGPTVVARWIGVGAGEAGAAGGVAGSAGGVAGGEAGTAAGAVGTAGGEAAVTSGNGAAQVAGMGNIGSHAASDVSTALTAAQRWLGTGYREIAPGVYRSADGLRQFRMTTSDLLPTHGNIGPHVHFEALNPAGVVIENLHLPIVP